MTKKEMFKALDEFEAALNKFLIAGVDEIQRQEHEKVKAGDFGDIEKDEDGWFDNLMGWFNDQRDTKLGFIYAMEREIKKFHMEVAKCDLYEAGGERELD